MNASEAATLEELIERLSAVRRDRTLSHVLARWTDAHLFDEPVLLDPGELRDVICEISCQWENIVTTAHDYGDPLDMPHEFPDAMLAQWLARAVAIR